MKEKLAEYAGGEAMSCPACNAYYRRWVQLSKARGPSDAVSYTWRCSDCKTEWAETIDGSGRFLSLGRVKGAQDVQGAGQ